MNKFTTASLALAAALAIVPSALATTITTGSGGSLITEVGSTSGSITGSPTPFVGNYTESVWTYNGAGDLAFEYTVTNATPGLDEIAELSTGYDGYANSSLLLEAVSGDGVSGSYLTNPAGSITVSFNGGLGNAAIGASGIDNSTFILFTDATAFAGGPITLQDNGVGSSTALVPAPEPSGLLLLGTGLFALAFVAFRKAKSSGAAMNLAM